MRDIDIAQLPRHIGGATTERVGGMAIGSARQQHAGWRQQGVHRTGMQRSDTTLVGVFHPGSGIQQQRHQCSDMCGIAITAGA